MADIERLKRMALRGDKAAGKASFPGAMDSRQQ